MTSLDVSRSAPESQGVDAIEIWMLLCICMVFAALFEYGMILFVKFRKFEKNQKDSQTNGIQGAHANDDGRSINFNVNRVGHSDGASRAASAQEDEKCGGPIHVTGSNLDPTVLLCRKIDSISLFLFPVTFSFFLAIYFVLYLKIF